MKYTQHSMYNNDGIKIRLIDNGFIVETREYMTPHEYYCDGLEDVFKLLSKIFKPKE